MVGCNLEPDPVESIGVGGEHDREFLDPLLRKRQSITRHR